jgi:hypothetical protein
MACLTASPAVVRDASPISSLPPGKWKYSEPRGDRRLPAFSLLNQ